MTLAAVSVTTSEFDRVQDHLRSHSLGYGNMHLREPCQRNGKRVLRYLHAITSVGNAIEGAISGPAIFWRYTLTRQQLTVTADQASTKERQRIADRFLQEILARVHEEQTRTNTFPPKRASGQYYLRRNHNGTPLTHPTCASAVKAGVLDPAFVALLAGWRFQLLYQQ